MTQRDERLYLAEILEAIDRALMYTAVGREAFFEDPKTQDAVVRNIEIIGEAVRGLSKGAMAGITGVIPPGGTVAQALRRSAGATGSSVA
jgi:uncharacterized protein with HEPN domain